MTPYLLPAAAALAATAHVRLQAAPPPASRLTALVPVSTGLLPGWTTLASVINVVAARSDRDSPRATAVLPLAAAALAWAALRSPRGGRAVALASGWGLTTLAATRRRAVVTRLTAIAARGAWTRRDPTGTSKAC
ncbi:hypothetical protein AB0J83_23265 [Actinoplanes sp. NPDC049596]|uniref:hypothetical protein n=1 Tax=unclassified Actinoplanes TaxID=2626549 RepID=UPI0034433599